MKKGRLFTLIALVGLSGSAQETATATNAPVQLSEAGRLYGQAVAQREAGDPKQAIQTVAEIVALHMRDEQWMPKVELLSAELYVELDLLDAADVTARQVQSLYEGTDVAETATALREDIKKIKAEKKPVETTDE
jgi:outer membrane protein assembly factor BamD (BamD/ComL family)